MGTTSAETGEVLDKSVGAMKAQYFKEPGDAAWDRQAGPRRAFVPPSAHCVPPVWVIAVGANLLHFYARAGQRRPLE
jgi:hypothetical protein